MSWEETGMAQSRWLIEEDGEEEGLVGFKNDG